MPGPRSTKDIPSGPNPDELKAQVNLAAQSIDEFKNQERYRNKKRSAILAQLQRDVEDLKVHGFVPELLERHVHQLDVALKAIAELEGQLKNIKARVEILSRKKK